MAEYPLQSCVIPTLQSTCNEGLALGVAQCTLRGEHIATQNGGQGHCHDHRGEQRHDERDTERTQHTSLHTVEEEQRHKCHDCNDRCIDDRRTDLGRCCIDHLEPAATLLFGQLMVFAQASEYVFDVDNRVIDQRSDSDGHTTQTHRVDRQIHQFQYENRHEQRQRNCNERDGRNARVHHKEEQHDHHKQSSLDQRTLNVVDRRGDKARLTEDVGRDVDILRQRFLQIRELVFECFGQLDRAGLVLLGYGEQNGGLCALRRNTQARALCSDTHLANICQRDGLTVVGQFDHTAGDLVGIFGCQHTTHDKLVAILIENATRRVERHIFRCGQHLVYRNAQQAQLFGR